MANLGAPRLLSPTGRKNLLHPEDAERPKDPLPLPPTRPVARRTARPSSPVPLMKSDKLPQSFPPIGKRSTSPRLARKMGENAPIQPPPPSTASRFGLSKSTYQLTLICESEDEKEDTPDNCLSVRGAVSCPNSPLLGRRSLPKSAILTTSSFNQAFAHKKQRDLECLNSNNNEEKTDKNEQNNKTKFVLPEIIVQ
ncbi:uncharacterized protein LOC144433952 [Glandiceps talaboti]